MKKLELIATLALLLKSGLACEAGGCPRAVYRPAPAPLVAPCVPCAGRIIGGPTPIRQCCPTSPGHSGRRNNVQGCAQPAASQMVAPICIRFLPLAVRNRQSWRTPPVVPIGVLKSQPDSYPVPVGSDRRNPCYRRW